MRERAPRACLSAAVLEERARFQRIAVPTLFRFLVVIAVLAGLGFAAIFALATFVEPQPREMTTTIPPNRLPAR